MAENNSKLLLDALNKGNLRRVEQLLLGGTDPNCVLEDENVTPMHLAAGLGLKSVCLLVQHAGDPNVRIQDGTTPVHVAAMWGDSDCVQILMANGGDPFLRDEDGMSALDLAQKYGHDSVVQVLETYIHILAHAEEHTITPKFTYTRRSLDSNTSQQSVSPAVLEKSNNSFEDDNQDLKDYLHAFARRRRSSMYLRHIQSQVDMFFRDGRRTHAVDVTSPDHPYIEQKYSKTSTDDVIGYEDSPGCHYGNQAEDSLHLHLSMSDNDQSTSCDSFVTCDGEDLDTILLKEKNLETSYNSEEDEEEDSKTCFNTVIKNTKFISTNNSSSNSQLSSEEETYTYKLSNHEVSNGFKSRGDKYCRRRPLFPPASTQDLFTETLNMKCEYCGCYVENYSSENEIICAACERLGLELDNLAEDKNTKQLPDIVHQVSNRSVKNIAKRVVNNDRYLCTKIQNKDVEKYERTVDKPQSILTNRSRYKESHTKEAVDKLIHKFRRSSLSWEAQVELQDLKSLTIHVQGDRRNVSEKPELYNGQCHPTDHDSIISSDESFFERQHEKAEFHPSDISTISTLDDYSYQDKAFIDSLPGSYKSMRINGPVHTVNSSKSNISEKSSNSNATRQMNLNKENVPSPEYNDLWSQVRASNSVTKKLRERCNVLDTAFVGRGSLGSVLSDASTVEYIYTDKEKGITLVERHIPSQCGSVGSRRSLDSLFSLNTNDMSSNGGSPTEPKSSLSSANSSQDTVLYRWREHAMIKVSDDSGAGDSIDKTNPVSVELQSLDNNTVRSKLCDLGDDPGPVTITTRQAYLKRLSQLERDPDHKLLTFRGPEYPPELRLALEGKLDQSDMADQETKMMAAFQNPNRLRRWREGTLKSSFNYILLDPRITKDLPNRACNMGDLDVFKTFISAIFYIGKGKRARPYCHLYEAIKQMKQPTDKRSRKVQKILDIWSCDLGVVSLHCYQSVIPVEAYTREACMVDAMGLSCLTNMKRGDYYGVSTTYSMKERRKIGVYLLSKALQIFLAEGERQIAPLDVKNDP